MNANSMRQGLIAAGVILTAAAALKCAQSIHLLGADATGRGAQVITGLALAYYANLIPKRPSAPNGPGSRSTSVLLLSGWAFSIAGLAYAAIWAFAPDAFQLPLSMAAMGSAGVVSVGYCLLARRRSNPTVAL